MADLNVSNPISDLLNLGGKIIDKIFPNADEAAKNKLALLQMAQSGELDELKVVVDDIASARTLAGQDIAGGNNFTRFLSATVRPVAGYLAIAAVAYAVVTGKDLAPLVKDTVETVFEFYFGGRVLEKIVPHLSAAVSNFGGK